MKRYLLAALAVGLAAQFISVDATGAAGADYLVEPFSSPPSTWTSDWFDADIGSRNRITAISDGVNGAGINVSVPAGSHFGTAAQYRFTDQGLSDPDELYYRYYLRLPDNFVNYGTGKIPGPAGLYSASGRNKIKPTDANPGWSARMQFSSSTTPASSSTTQLGFYVYHRDQAGAAGDNLEWDPSTGSVTHGTWHCVEGHVSMNSPGVRNGVLEGWVDEQLAYYRDDFRFLGSADAALGVQSFWFDTYFGGTNPAPGALNFQFDELALSSERIGCGDIEAARFTDTSDSVHQADIERLAYAEITLGCNPPANDRYCPTTSVTRGQMAAFLTRALSLPAASVGDRFSDDNESIFEDSIERLAEAGITLGCNPPTNDRFCPDSRVTRGQMAAFLTRALSLPAASVGDRFTDDNDSEFESSIERMAEAGITLGCNPPTNDRYCPTSAVTRAQMATFLTRALDLPAPPVVPYSGPTVPVVPSGFDAAVPAGWSVQAVSNVMPTGARIYIEPGLHNVQTVVPKDGQSFEGGVGTIFDGQGQKLDAFSGSSTGVSISGIDIRNYERGFVVSGSGWSIDDVSVDGATRAVVMTGNNFSFTNSVFTNQVQESVLVTGSSGGLFRNVTIDNANTSKLTSFSASIKLLGTNAITIDESTISDGYGYGVWFTNAASNTTITDSTIADNYRTGILHDRAYGSTISNNAITGNGRVVDPNPQFGAGILVFGPDAVISANRVGANSAGIVAIIHSSDLNGPSGLYIPTGMIVTDNLVLESGRNGINVAGYPAVYSTSQFQGNDYRYADVTERYWAWESIPRTWADWQSFGQDTAGSLSN